MKKIFYSHPDTIIAALAVIFLGSLIWFYSLASNDIYTEVHQALTYTPSTPSESFNLSGAAKLDLRGIYSTSTAASAAVATTTSAFQQ